MPNYIHAQLLRCFITVIAVTISSLVSAAPRGHAPWVGDSFQGIPCDGQIENFGPFDYMQRGQFPNELGIVERHHFNSNVELLISGQTNTGPLPDLDYTLRAWPNHHRALYSAVKYRIRELNSDRPLSRRHTSAECYLQRAHEFSPKDGTVLMLYGMLSHRTDHRSQAAKLYRESLILEPENLLTQYNFGLLLTESGDFTEANQYAQNVYAHGFPLPGLRNKLEKAGHWKEHPKDIDSSGDSKVQE
jgi:hypothetical protein